MSNSKNTIIGSLIGLTAGFAAGVLLAPKSGKETRQDITDTVNNGVKSLEESAANTLEEARKLLNRQSAKVEELETEMKDRS